MKVWVTLKPRSKQEKIVKTRNGFLAYVKEPPVNGKANKALIHLLSKNFGVPKDRITILTGRRSKHKLVEIEESLNEGINS